MSQLDWEMELPTAIKKSLSQVSQHKGAVLCTNTNNIQFNKAYLFDTFHIANRKFNLNNIYLTI